MSLSTFPVRITPRAIAELERLGGGASTVVHLAVAGMSCCGMDYRLSLATADLGGPHVTKDFGPVRLLVDSADLARLADVTIDYLEEGSESGFLVQGPIDASCGCGHPG